MSAMFIPRVQPHLLYAIDVPSAGPNYVAAPVIAADAVLVTSNPYQYLLAPYPHQTTILQAHDLRTGAQRFAVTVPIEAIPRDFLQTAPGITANGMIMQGIYQQDTFLHVYSIDQAGLIVSQDRLYDDASNSFADLQLHASDLSIKLTLSPIIPCAEDTYLISWHYRQGRFTHMEYRQRGNPVPLWMGDEFWAGNTAEIVVGTSASKPAYRITARHLQDGALRWSHHGELRMVTLVDHDIALIVANPYANSEGIYQALPPDIPTIAAWDLHTGIVQWEHALATSIVVSVQAGPTRICAIAIDKQGSAHLHCFNHRGALLWTRHLRQSEPFPLSRWDLFFHQDSGYPWPTLAAVDAGALLLTIGTTLHCLSLQSGKHLWHIELPEDLHTVMRRVVDNSYGQLALAVSDGIIVGRNQRLFAYGIA